MTSRIERLQKRLDKISPPTKPEADCLDVKAKTAWVLDHLTLSEEKEFIEAILAVEKLRPGQATEAQLDRLNSIMLKGEQRAATEPPERWQEYESKWMRVETLGMVGRPPTEAEALERQQLKAWLDATHERLSKEIEKNVGA